MKLKFALFLVVLQVKCSLSLDNEILTEKLRESPLAKMSPFDLTKNRNCGIIGFNRGKRCLSTALSLLWPQVVGPVEQGVIKENGYDVVPKTLLEYRLDLIRKKAEEEEENRLAVRDYLKKLTEAQDKFYGFPFYDNSVRT